MHLTLDVIWALKTQAQNSQNCFRWNLKERCRAFFENCDYYCAEKYPKIAFFQAITY